MLKPANTTFWISSPTPTPAPSSIRERSAARFWAGRRWALATLLGRSGCSILTTESWFSKRFHHNKPPTIVDIPANMQWRAVNIPDPETPVGARGIGEPPVAGGCASILNALSDALGDE